MHNARLTRWSLRVRVLDRHGNRQERAVLRLGAEAESSGHPALDAETLSGSGEGRVDRDVHGGERGRLVGEVVLDEGGVCVELRRGGVPAKPSAVVSASTSASASDRARRGRSFRMTFQKE
jgi:hypothetical protein